MHPIGPELPISAHVACARVCRQLYVLRASHALVQATIDVGTVIIVYIGVAYTKGGGNCQASLNGTLATDLQPPPVAPQPLPPTGPLAPHRAGPCEILRLKADWAQKGAACPTRFSGCCRGPHGLCILLLLEGCGLDAPHGFVVRRGKTRRRGPHGVVDVLQRVVPAEEMYRLRRPSGPEFRFARRTVAPAALAPGRRPWSCRSAPHTRRGSRSRISSRICCPGLRRAISVLGTIPGHRVGGPALPTRFRPPAVWRDGDKQCTEFAVQRPERPMAYC